MEFTPAMKTLWKPTASPPLPRTSLFFIRKTLKCVLSEGSHTVKNPGYRDFKSSYWKKILGTEISNPLLEENPGYRDFKSWYWKKIPVTGIWNAGTGKKSRVLGFQIATLHKKFRALPGFQIPVLEENPNARSFEQFATPWMLHVPCKPYREPL